MRDKTLKLWLLAVLAMLLVPANAYAAGLGRLIVLSTLGHPLNAEVELLSVQKNETITGRLASPDVYQQANAQYNNALVGTRVTVERRPNGEPYLKVTTPRPVNEPFIELLIEINSEHGRMMRQYTALLDPPGYGRAAGEIPPPSVAAPQTRAAPAPAPAPPADIAPVPEPGAAAVARPAPAAKPAPAATPAPAPVAGAKQYGPIKPGETLGRIARSVKPEGVSLEQTLVGLYRQNPDAFIKKNMNLVRSGRILKVPDVGELASLPQREAVQEVRLQVADFNAYRDHLASRAVGAPEDGSVKSGRIGSRVADKAAGEGPRDTVRLSNSEPSGKGKGAAKGAAAERVRALEDEAVAREKALMEANARIARLEQIIKDTQRAAELKSGPAAAPGQKGAADKAAPPAPPSAVAVAPPPGVPSAKPAAAPAGAPPVAGKAAAPHTAAEPPKGPEKTPVDAAPKAEPPPVAKAKKPAPPPPPPPAPSFVDTLMSEPLYLAAAGVVLLGGLGFMMARRRRTADGRRDPNQELVKIPPSLAVSPSAEAPADGTASDRSASASSPAAPAPVEQVTVQPPRSPRARNASAADDNDLDFNAATGRAAPAAVPGANRYAPAPEPAPPQQPRPEPARAPEMPRAAQAPAPEPPSAPPPPRVTEPPPRAPQPEAAEPLPDFALDAPSPSAPTIKPEPAAPAADPHTIDFNLEPLPSVGSPMDLDKVSSEPPASVDFKLDLSDLDINAPARTIAGPARDDHWYDVQQKFDLAKAYEEMGDKDGARDILQEVVREGDTEQQAQATKLLGSLG